ncbi:hypothetical protein GGS26DRAFT_550468 [Hypomontagnella submonticulosa]|nr:hypothetical protein GGS26DRAFT_550468 [Hypomontagnella submonticulosa]
MDEAIPPPIQGVALSLVLTSTILVATATILVCFRVFIRWSEGLLWWDDGLMFIGLIIHILDVHLSCKSAYYGLGSDPATLSEPLKLIARRYLTIWSLLHPACLVTVKTSVCVTMLRLTRVMRYIRFSIYALLVISILAFLLNFVSILTYCRPFAANWDSTLLIEGNAACAPPGAILIVSYITAGITIATDIACAILPAAILWKSQLKFKTKLLVGLLLSFGSLASVCTMIRTPYVKYYITEEQLYWMGMAALWSNMEIAIVLIAGSIPVLQKLMMRCLTCHKAVGVSPNPTGFVTFGSVPVRPRINRGGLNNPTDASFNISAMNATPSPHPWERLEDDTSARFLRSDEVELAGVSAPQLTEVRE